MAWRWWLTANSIIGQLINFQLQNRQKPTRIQSKVAVFGSNWNRRKLCTAKKNTKHNHCTIEVDFFCAVNVFVFCMHGRHLLGTENMLNGQMQSNNCMIEIQEPNARTHKIDVFSQELWQCWLADRKNWGNNTHFFRLLFLRVSFFFVDFGIICIWIDCFSNAICGIFLWVPFCKLQFLFRMRKIAAATTKTTATTHRNQVTQRQPNKNKSTLLRIHTHNHHCLDLDWRRW